MSSSVLLNYTTAEIRNLLNRTKDANECEKLVLDGTFASILKKHSDLYNGKIKNIIADQLNEMHIFTISRMVSRNQDLFRDPDFVINLKPGFAEASKLYENNKNSEIWIPFAIVENLKKTSQKNAILIANDGSTKETAIIENHEPQRNYIQEQERDYSSFLTNNNRRNKKADYGLKTKNKKPAQSASQALPI